MRDNPTHTIHKEHGHYGWDNSLPPCLIVSSDETVAFECRDASAGQFSRDTVASDVPKIDLA